MLCGLPVRHGICRRAPAYALASKPRSGKSFLSVSGFHKLSVAQSRRCARRSRRTPAPARFTLHLGACSDQGASGHTKEGQEIPNRMQYKAFPEKSISLLTMRCRNITFLVYASKEASPTHPDKRFGIGLDQGDTLPKGANLALPALVNVVWHSRELQAAGAAVQEKWVSTRSCNAYFIRLLQ